MTRLLTLLSEKTTFNNLHASLHENITLNSQLAEATIQVKWQPDWEWKDASLLQYLASQTAKSEQLELLLNHGYVRTGWFFLTVPTQKFLCVSR